MKYCELGNTGLLVSEIGLGCEGFAEDGYRNTKKLLDEAQSQGINYFDLYVLDPKLRACETRCPFHVPIMENMREAEKLFGK